MLLDYLTHNRKIEALNGFIVGMNNKFLNYFCPLCWKPAHNSDEKSKFCVKHRQPINAKEYKKRRRLLENVKKEKGKDIPINEIFNSLLSEVASEDSVNRSITKSSKNRAGNITIYEISKVCAARYKKCFSELVHIDVSRFKNILDWGVAIINAMTKEHALEIAAAWRNICESNTPVDQRKLIIHLLSRIEVEKQELSTSLTRGPNLGSVDINFEVMQSLLIAYHELMEAKIRVNLSSIAKEHGITRQAVHAKWKMLQRDPKVYRKAINSKNNNN